jgi:peptidoglycan hydrolase-like protein with peptidoglycan-binding domain
MLAAVLILPVLSADWYAILAPRSLETMIPQPSTATSAFQVPMLASKDASRQAADARRLADETGSFERLQQEQAATKAAEEQQALVQADREARANAESIEAELRLTNRDRQKLQIVLRSLGLDPGGIDGMFGPRSREMISAWQNKRGEPSTGFVTASQNAALLNEGRTAIARWEEAQRRASSEEERHRQQQQHQQQQPRESQRRSGWRWPWE